MREYATPLKERQRLAAYARERYWRDESYRLAAINRGRVWQGLEPRASLDEVQAR